ncbi:MAG: Crp/Fnr family transcriptional regulator [Clostridium argentinense]|nr:Crp/Fnr family transcriptional regulator [Clostridium argentinense]
MEHIIKVLKKCILFKNLSEEEIKDSLSKVRYTIYDQYENSNNSKTCVLALEGDDCTSLGIVLEGAVEIQKQYPNGKVVSLSTLKSGNIFGEAIVFSTHHKYPATIMGNKNSTVMYILKEDIISMCSSNKLILNNFMEILSSKILNLNKKITELSLETLRQKLCFYLLQEYKKQNNLKLTIPMSKKSLSEYFGVQRPSLSRELINMKKDNLIDYDKNIIKILDLDGLQQYIEIY